MRLKNKRLFISRPAGSLLRDWCEANGVELLDWSLIEFLPLRPIPKQTPDVIFYSSPRSVEFSSNIREQFPKAASAAIGEGTAASLLAFGVSVDFTGKNAANPAAVAAEFISWLGDQRVLFPVSTQSLGTISSQVPENQREIVSVYETIACSKIVPPCDFYVFSSPSNWKSFLVENTPEPIIFAWGKSTSKAIVDSCRIEPVELEESSEKQLIIEIEKLVE